MTKSIEITPALRARIESVRAALVIYQPGFESAARVEVSKCELADALLAAVAAQEARHAAKAERLARVPKAKPAFIVEVTLTPKRRHRA